MIFDLNPLSFNCLLEARIRNWFWRQSAAAAMIALLGCYGWLRSLYAGPAGLEEICLCTGVVL